MLTRTSVACRAPSATTTGSGWYSSRPPASTVAVTVRTDSPPSRPGSATDAATVRRQSAAPALTSIRKSRQSPPIGPAAALTR
jgi:hypothetical protein